MGRETRTLALGGLVVAVVIAAVVACGGGSSPRPTARATFTPAAEPMSLIKSSYEGAEQDLDSHAVSFGIEVRNAVQANDGMTLYGASQGFAGALAGFDDEVQGIAFPAPLSGKEQALLKADKSLQTDLQEVGTAQDVQTWVARWNDDVVSAQTTHDSLTRALGLPDDTFLQKI